MRFSVSLLNLRSSVYNLILKCFPGPNFDDCFLITLDGSSANWTKALICTSPCIFTDYDLCQIVSTNFIPVMMVNGLRKVFYIIKEKHSVFIISLFRKFILRNRVCAETQSQTVLQKENEQWGLYVSILSLKNKRMMEKRHISVRDSPDFVLFKPVHISVDTFCKWQYQGRHALSL